MPKSQSDKDFVVITRKIEVHLHYDSVADPDKTEYNRQWERWRTINDYLYKAANRISSHLFFNDEYENRLRIQSSQFRDIDKALRYSKKNKLSAEEISDLKNKRKALLSDFSKQTKEFLGGSPQNSTYKVASDEFLEYIPSEILTCLNQNIVSAYNQLRLEVASGQRSMSNYKRGIPVPFSIKRAGEIKLYKRDDGSIYLDFVDGLKWNLAFGRDRSNNREIVERVLSGQYDVGNSSLQEKNHKIFLLLVVKLPKTENQLDKNRVVGIDLGINIPLYAALNDNEYGGLAVGSRDKFMKERERMNARRRELQRSLRTSTQGGRGRGHKLQALEIFNEKERNWTHTQNHIFSHEVVEYAKSNQAGVIQMERLSGFGKDNDGDVKDGAKYLLRYWSYFELQNLIEQKAAREGIEVRYINPYHTSQTCSFCGHYEPGQRIEQAVFVCKNPECEKGKGKQMADGTFKGINADWNAARNIALSKDIVKK